MTRITALLLGAALAGLPFAGARRCEASSAAELLARAPRGMPGAQSSAQCESLEKRWTEFSKEISRAHEACLNAGGHERPKRGLECTRASCESLHVLMSELGDGSLARRRLLQAQTCANSANRAAEAARRATDRAQARKDKSARAFEDAARRNDEETSAAMEKLGASMNQDEESLRQALAKEAAIPRAPNDPKAVERMRKDAREYDAALDERERCPNCAAAEEAFEQGSQVKEWVDEAISGGASLAGGALEGAKILLTPPHENPSYLGTFDENHEVMRAVVIRREARKSYERELQRTTDYYLHRSHGRFREPGDKRPTFRPHHPRRSPLTGGSTR